jgi:nicotinamide-nucleotide amidase
MKIAVITIGDEILSGFTVNTNGAWIGQKLLENGLNVDIQLTIGDKKKEIIKYLKVLSKEKYSNIIVTGGLGPTHDDITSLAFYEYFDSKQEFDEIYWQELTKRFAKRNIKIPEKNRNQATKPDNGKVLENKIGSARGLFYQKNRINYFALPGVPSEMRSMMINEVLPIINLENDSIIFTRTIKTIGFGESAIAEQMDNLDDEGIKIAFLPQLGKVDIRLFSPSEQKLVTFSKQVKKLLGNMIYGYNDVTIEESVAELLITNNLTIATAESCTGGLLAHRLTNVSGSSQYMEGGIVCYNNDVKIEKVGVNKQTIIDHGAVSEETAYELSLGIKEKFKTDIGVGITGIAGPTGGTDEKPIGLVYIGLAINESVKVKRFQFLNDRNANKLLSSQTALNMLRLELSE